MLWTIVYIVLALVILEALLSPVMANWEERNIARWKIEYDEENAAWSQQWRKQVMEMRGPRPRHLKPRIRVYPTVHRVDP